MAPADSSPLLPPPHHVGIILDGNRRWARQRGLPDFLGHRQGSEQIEDVAKAAFALGVEILSLFVFSTENWRRSLEEVDYLMKLFLDIAKKQGKRLIDENYRIKFLGRRDDKRLNPKLIKSIEQMESDSVTKTGPTVVFCFNYGGQLEVVDAVKKLLVNKVDPANLTPEMISKELYYPEIPPVDLIIRTSGEQRISGFLLWRAAYAEMMFVDKFWPDFGVQDIKQAINAYRHRQRRLGGD